MPSILFILILFGMGIDDANNTKDEILSSSSKEAYIAMTEKRAKKYMIDKEKEELKKIPHFYRN